jgi:hypothetical protein
MAKKDGECAYDPPIASGVQMENAEEVPTTKEDNFVGDDIPNEETRDDTDDYLGYLAYLARRKPRRGAWRTSSLLCHSTWDEGEGGRARHPLLPAFAPTVALRRRLHIGGDL